jgi:hypothetical protein
MHVGSPQSALDEIRGKVWRTEVEKQDVPEYERAHNVVSTRLRGGKTMLHVLADEDPGAPFRGAEPDLRDVYFIKLGGSAVGADEAGGSAASGGARAADGPGSGGSGQGGVIQAGGR